MRGSSFFVRHHFLCLLVLSLFLVSCSGGGDENSSSLHRAVLAWNQAAIDASGLDHEQDAAQEQFGPTKSSRAMAMAHLAMFEALNAVTPRYTSAIGLNPVADREELVPRLTLAKAASETLTFLYPSQEDSFQHFLEEEVQLADGFSLQQIQRSLDLGSMISERVIELRQNDGSELSTADNERRYNFSQLPGRWRKDPFNPNQTPLGSRWGSVRPFVLQSADQFRAPPPPAISSPEYAEAYAEVFRVGGDGIQTPTERTAEQTEIGIFWAYDGTPSLCAPPRMYNQLARVLIEKYGPEDALETARVLSLVNVAMADTAISIWEAKYFYDFWRPVTAIRESDPGTGPTGLGDNNSLTPGDPDFKPLGSPASNLFQDNFTPPFPTYPSGHGGFGGAVFQTLRNYYGSDHLPFSFISDEFNGQTLGPDGNPRPVVERFFETLSEAEEENAQSRVYLGIHFSFDKSSSIRQGRSVGDYVFNNLHQELLE